MNSLMYGLWLFGPLVQFGLIISMSLRKLRREFPVFYAYTVFHVLREVVSFAAMKLWYASYLWVFWGAELVDMILTLAVVQEVYAHTFRPYPALQQFANNLFRWGGIFLALFCVISAAPAHGVSRLLSYALALDKSGCVIAFGLIAFLLLVARGAGLRWRSHAFGIAVGLGMATSIFAATIALRINVPGEHARQIFLLVQAAAYDIGICTWAAYLFWPSRSPESAHGTVDRMAVERWNQAIRAVIER